jgi:NAD(P)-dependent dehydrogenase (short-subunit alcohol dehydrogenase family)
MDARHPGITGIARTRQLSGDVLAAAHALLSNFIGSARGIETGQRSSVNWLEKVADEHHGITKVEKQQAFKNEEMIMKISFEDKVALVTGAASGLGLATARAFAEAGASVVLADWNEKEVQAAAKGLADKGHKTLAVRCDVSDDAQVEAMVRQTVAYFGQLDAAYNNAGVQGVLAETADSARDDYDRVMAINLRGVWSCMKFELQQMREQGSGAIVNCSSLGGLIGGNRRGTYHAAKHGVIGFTKSAALEYATRGIRVNDVCPGMIQTPMSDKMIAEGQGEELNAMLKTFVPMGRMGRPEEIADAVLWLCSSAASYVTGQSISVDGGYVMR